MPALIRALNQCRGCIEVGGGPSRASFPGGPASWCAGQSCAPQQQTRKHLGCEGVDADAAAALRGSPRRASSAPVLRDPSANSARQDPRLARSTEAPQQKTPQQKTPQQQTGPTGRRPRALPRTVANLPPWTCHVILSQLEPWETRRSCCGLVHHSRRRSCAPAVQARRRLSPWSRSSFPPVAGGP